MYSDQLLCAARQIHVAYSDQHLGAACHIHLYLITILCFSNSNGLGNNVLDVGRCDDVVIDPLFVLANSKMTIEYCFKKVSQINKL